MKQQHLKVFIIGAAAAQGLLLADESDYTNSIRQTVHAHGDVPEITIDIENIPASGNQAATVVMGESGATFELISVDNESGEIYELDTKYIGPKMAEVVLTSMDPFTQLADQDGDGVADSWQRTRRDMPFSVAVNVQLPSGSTATEEFLYMQWNGVVNPIGNHDFNAGDHGFDYDSNGKQVLGSFAETIGFSYSFPNGSNLSILQDQNFNSHALDQSGFESYSIWSSDGTKLDSKRIQILPVASSSLSHSNGVAFTSGVEFDRGTPLTVTVADTYPDSNTWIKVKAITGPNSGENATVYELDSFTNTTNDPQNWVYQTQDFIDGLPNNETYSLEVTTQASFDASPIVLSSVTFKVDRKIAVRAGINSQ